MKYSMTLFLLVTSMFTILNPEMIAGISRRFDFVLSQTDDFSCDQVSKIPIEECQALVALYNHTDGENWANQIGWLDTVDPCSWYGLYCETNQNITHINLYNNQLSGSLPDEIVDLSQLRSLLLGNNQISGSIPGCYGSLPNLESLDLQGNQLSGSIPPEMGDLSNLYYLNLSSNDLSGEIPIELAGLSQLSNLTLNNNELSGSIPAEMGLISTLLRLTLYENNLSGAIPPELGSLANLQGLNIHGNSFTGTIPSELGQLTNLVDLELGSNQLSGEIPDSVWDLQNLTNLGLGWNGLSGQIPAEIGQLENLTGLNISHNQLSGSIPSAFGNLHLLNYLEIEANGFTGPLPDSMVNLTEMNFFNYSATNLCAPNTSQFTSWLSSIETLSVSGLVCASPAKTPVILLPGMFASWSDQCLLYGWDCDVQGRWGWVWDPNTQKSSYYYYENLIEAFERSGYQQSDATFNVFFYDWRKPFDHNASRLNDFIDSVKMQSHSDQVILIGHSMGGVIARTYVQSSNYNYDVQHLITIGSPHKGAAFAYPYWEAGYLYRLLPYERYANALIQDAYRATNPDISLVQLIRENIPVAKDLLPTDDYVDGYGLTETPGYIYLNGFDFIPEVDMIHRNVALSIINHNRALVYRTDVTTMAGTGIDTPARFMVLPQTEADKPNWDDGVPWWDWFESAFLDSRGDDTVMASSAQLPSPANNFEYDGVGHGTLPGYQRVIEDIFTVLGIPLAPASGDADSPQEDDSEHRMMVFSIYGQADLLITDQLGNVVGRSECTIPGSKYVSHPYSEYKQALIPDPEEGKFKVDVQGYEHGGYRLGILDTFNPYPERITDTIQLWDISPSAIHPDETVHYAITYTMATSPTIGLIAETPVIEIPAWMGSWLISGRARPGARVEIYSRPDRAILGFSQADENGFYQVNLDRPLADQELIYPVSDGVTGPEVRVSAHQVFLPIVVYP